MQGDNMIVFLIIGIIANFMLATYAFALIVQAYRERGKRIPLGFQLILFPFCIFLWPVIILFDWLYPSILTKL